MPKIDLQDKPQEEEIDQLVDSLSVLDEEAEISEEEKEEMREEMKKESAFFNETLSKVGSQLENEFSDFARRRHTKEREWIDAILQYSHKDDFYPKEVYERGAHRQIKHPKINITAHKVDMAIARMLDIQLPTGGDFNFHLDPVKEPDLEEYLGDETPTQTDPEITRAQVAEAGLMENLDKAKRMQLRIQDQLVKSDYGRKTREGIRDWILLGTCVMKGPVIQNTRRKRYEHHPDSEGGLQSEQLIDISQEPVVEHVDIRFFYPDPECLIPEELEKAYEIRPVSKTELIKVTDNEAFMKDRVRRVLEKTPDGQNEGQVFNLNGILDSEHSLKNKYILKTYNGPLDKDLLMMMDMITEEELEDPFVEMFGEIWFVQGEIVRVSLSPFDADDRPCYHLVVWEKDDTHLFGHGMPYKMRDQARVTNSAWKMLLDNAGLSAGPQLALNKEMIKPANGNWDIEPFKIWWLTEYGTRVDEAIQFVNVPNNQENLSNVIQMAMQFADIESNTPMIAQNMMPQANNASGMGLILTEANVTQRELSMAWDKYITVPLIERFVDYNMQYSSAPEIKGNFEVHVGAATQRIDNQIIAQDLERILAMAQQDPMYQIQIDPQAAFRKWAAATRVGPEILRSVEEVRAEIQRMEEEAANQPPDPEQMKAQAILMQEETRQQRLQADVEGEEQERMAAEQQRQFERELKIAELEQKDRELQARLLEKEADREALLIKIAADNQKTLAQITKDLDIASLNNETSRINKAIDMEKFREQVKLKGEHGTGVSMA